MGYTTYFNGGFTFDKPVDEETAHLLKGLNTTRRMKRNPTKLAKRLGITRKEVIKKYGKECEFWFESADMGQEHTDDIVDYNAPPDSQPGLWCQWLLDDADDQVHILVWDEGEKFYNYIEWLEYLIESIIKPRGYILNGTVSWSGEESTDLGEIDVTDNVITVKEAVVFYLTNEDAPRVRRLVDDYLKSNLKELMDTKIDSLG